MDKLEKQLKMPFGTATNRLRKHLLFGLAKRLNLLNCFRCNLPIDFISDFSIDHKKEWRGNDNKLFWDLDNIAFSHLKCNTDARRIKRNPRKIKGVESYCYACKKTLPVYVFAKDSTRWNGVRTKCSPCMSKYMEKYDNRRRKLQGRQTGIATSL